MKYIDLMNGFDRWLEGNYLPASSQLLWYRLVALCNRCGWTEWVQVDNLRLMAELQMKREASFIDSRNKLIEAGLIEHQKGKKGSPNRYKICTTVFTFTSEVQNGVNTEVESEVQSGVKTVVQTADINRQDKIKTRQKKKDISNDISKEKDPFSEYAGEDTEMLKALRDYEAMRKEKKDPLSTRAKELALSKLEKLAESRAEKIEVLEQSVLCGWKGLFELKGGVKGGAGKDTGGNTAAFTTRFGNYL